MKVRAPIICSIVIPVFNEAPLINITISHIRSLQSTEGVEIIVVDGDPKEETLRAICHEHEDVIRISSSKGRGIQMNEGAKKARGDVLLFLHADTELPPDSFHLIKAAMGIERYMAGAFDLGIKSKRFMFRVIEVVASLRSRVTKIPFGDQAIFMHKHYFHKIGGYKDIPIMEDVEIMKRIKRRGDKIFIIPQRVLTSSRRWEKEGVLQCTLRNWFLQMLYLFGVSPLKLSTFYRHNGYETYR